MYSDLQEVFFLPNRYERVSNARWLLLISPGPPLREVSFSSLAYNTSCSDSTVTDIYSPCRTIVQLSSACLSSLSVSSSRRRLLCLKDRVRVFNYETGRPKLCFLDSIYVPLSSSLSSGPLVASRAYLTESSTCRHSLHLHSHHEQAK